jgi:DNA invertase Pin-like site-specific DNA recombinase
MKIAIYTRLSPNPDKDDTINQERDLKNFAEVNKWEVVEIYSDIHVSGSKRGVERTEFKRMMGDASKRKFDTLLFWSLDRLSREGVTETLAYLNQLNAWGVAYKSYTEQYLDSCGIFKDVVIAIMATIAKQERVRLIERTRAGIQTARDKGTKSGKAIGRPKVVVDRVMVRHLKGIGWSIKQIAEKYETSVCTIYRALKEAS